MKTKKTDWADKRADKFYKELNGDEDLHNWFSKELRSAYGRGAKAERAKIADEDRCTTTSNWKRCLCKAGHHGGCHFEISASKSGTR